MNVFGFFEELNEKKGPTEELTLEELTKLEGSLIWAKLYFRAARLGRQLRVKRLKKKEKDGS